MNQPDRIAVFGGTLRWKAQYGRLAPLFFLIWRHALGAVVDRAFSEQVFTDWDEVDRFTDTFLQEAATTSKHETSHEVDKRRAMSQLMASLAQRVRHGRQQA